MLYEFIELESLFREFKSKTVLICCKGLRSLNNNFCPADFENNHSTKSIKLLQWLQTITYSLKINIFLQI